MDKTCRKYMRRNSLKRNQMYDGILEPLQDGERT